eukprot:g62495.t1
MHHSPLSKADTGYTILIPENTEKPLCHRHVCIVPGLHYINTNPACRIPKIYSPSEVTTARRPPRVKPRRTLPILDLVDLPQASLDASTRDFPCPPPIQLTPLRFRCNSFHVHHCDLYPSSIRDRPPYIIILYNTDFMAKKIRCNDA